jgi:RNA polymerase sigma-70 factor (ECF subfamily)
MDDGSLVARARAGDLDAAGELLARHQRLAYTTALRLVGNPTEAEDVAQDALVQAYTHLGDLEQDADFPPWLRRIAVNRSLNVLRRRGHLRFESLEAPPPGAVAESAAPRWELADERQRTPEEAAISAELLAELEALIRRLPAEQRVALVLRDVYGYDMADVAALQRCGLSAAKMRLSRGRATLRRLLAEKGVFEATGESGAET